MQAGNFTYATEADLPRAIPIFPLGGALLLPGGRLPLNIFEPRYLAMIDDVIAGHRVIGMVQPREAGSAGRGGGDLYDVGCCGRIASFSESGDGRYLIALHGICRFRVETELQVTTPYRQCRILPFVTDLDETVGEENVDRTALLDTLRAYLDANGMEADWDSISRAGNATLVNALAMMSPFGAAEKQALLEAPDLRARAETLIAITEMVLARESEAPTRLQ